MPTNPIITATGDKLGIRLVLGTPPSVDGDQNFDHWKISINGAPAVDVSDLTGAGNGGQETDISDFTPYPQAAGTVSVQLFAVYSAGDNDPATTLQTILHSGIVVSDFFPTVSVVPAAAVVIPTIPSGYSTVRGYMGGVKYYDSDNDAQQPGDTLYVPGAGSDSFTWRLLDSGSGLESADSAATVVTVPASVGGGSGGGGLRYF